MESDQLTEITEGAFLPCFTAVENGLTVVSCDHLASLTQGKRGDTVDLSQVFRGTCSPSHTILVHGARLQRKPVMGFYRTYLEHFYDTVQCQWSESVLQTFFSEEQQPFLADFIRDPHHIRVLAKMLERHVIIVSKVKDSKYEHNFVRVNDSWIGFTDQLNENKWPPLVLALHQQNDLSRVVIINDRMIPFVLGHDIQELSECVDTRVTLSLDDEDFSNGLFTMICDNG